MKFLWRTLLKDVHAFLSQKLVSVSTIWHIMPCVNLSKPLENYPPECCYFAAVPGLCASKTPEAMPAGVWLLIGFTMLDRLWGRGQTKCNTDATDAGNISAWTELVDDPVVVCPSQSPDWTSHGPTTRNAWVCVLCHLSCGYPLPCDAESLACHAGG